MQGSFCSWLKKSEVARSGWPGQSELANSPNPTLHYLSYHVPIFQLFCTFVRRPPKEGRPQPGLMIHSDRGIQYCCDRFRKAVDAHQFVQSMSKKADCWDNAVSESFFKTLKTEWLYHVDLTDLDHAERELFEYIEMFYNNQRLHAYLDYVSPALFEQLSLQKAA